MTRFLCQIASLGPVGALPAPGTAGSLVALLAGWAILSQAGWLWMLLAAVLATLLGWWAADIYVAETGKSDPSEVIIDEVAGQFSVLLVLPDVTFIWLLAGFALFRLFDIVKIWPVSAAEKLPGGLGIMADDIVAAGLAGLCLLGVQAVLV